MLNQEFTHIAKRRWTDTTTGEQHEQQAQYRAIITNINGEFANYRNIETLHIDDEAPISAENAECDGLFRMSYRNICRMQIEWL